MRFRISDPLVFVVVVLSIVFVFSTAVCFFLSHDVASEIEITPCNRTDKPLVIYRFSGNVMMSVTTLRVK